MLKHIMWQVLGFSTHLRHPLANLPHPISFPVGLGLLGRVMGGWPPRLRLTGPEEDSAVDQASDSLT